MSRILVVDDEQDLAWAVRHSLCDEGYEVVTAYNGVEAIAMAQRHRPDLIILDIVMPQLDGLEVCHNLRRDPTLAAVPILFLTVRRAIEDRIKGLDEGGDDYLVKPFDLQELKARVRALLRRGRSHPERPEFEGQRSPLIVGQLTLGITTRQVHCGGKTLQLTPTEFHLLKHLMVHRGQVLSERQLLQDVWNYPPGTANLSLVRWHIKNLRAKIEPNPAYPIYIRTVPHHGYKLEG